MKCSEYFMETWSVRKGWTNAQNLSSENDDIFEDVVVMILIINIMFVLNWCLNKTIITQIEMKISKIQERLSKNVRLVCLNHYVLEQGGRVWSHIFQEPKSSEIADMIIPDPRSYDRMRAELCP